MGALFSVLRVLYVQSYPSPKPGASILVTGCDTGFGHSLSVQLARLGYKVFALCLKEESIAELQQEANTSNLIGVQADVTKAADIAKVVALVEKESPQGLTGLVNNAGVNSGSLVDWSSEKDYRFVMEVNFFAIVNMTKALLPQLRKLKGKSRIVNVTSVAAFLSPPGMSTYSSSKHAAQAFSDALRLELAPWQIPVIVIQPGWMKTPIVTGSKSVISSAWEKLEQHQKDVYGEAFFKEYNSSVSSTPVTIASDPQVTVDAMLDALLSTYPKQVYRVGIDHVAYNIVRHLPHFVQAVFIGVMSYPRTKPISAF